MKWALAPEKAGRYEVFLITVSYFDTLSRQYREIRTTPHALSVLPGKAKGIQTSEDRTTQAGANGSVKEPVKELARDILPVYTSIQDAMTVHSTRPRGFLLPVFLLIPVLAYILTLFIQKFHQNYRAASALTKSKTAAGLTAETLPREELFVKANQAYRAVRF
jgi:hypothetical protein